MIKNYKLVLTGLLALCSGLHAMEKKDHTYAIAQTGDDHFKTGEGTSYTTGESDNPQQHNSSDKFYSIFEEFIKDNMSLVYEVDEKAKQITIKFKKVEEFDKYPLIINDIQKCMKKLNIPSKINWITKEFTIEVVPIEINKKNAYDLFEFVINGIYQRSIYLTCNALYTSNKNKRKAKYLNVCLLGVSAGGPHWYGVNTEKAKKIKIISEKQKTILKQFFDLIKNDKDSESYQDQEKKYIELLCHEAYVLDMPKRHLQHKFDKNFLPNIEFKSIEKLKKNKRNTFISTINEEIKKAHKLQLLVKSSYTYKNC